MPRLVQALPKYRKHKASGQAIATLNGADQYLGPHGTLASRLQYDRLIAEWLQADAGFDSANPYRNSLAKYFLPNANEWYKAAFYDPITGLYSNYATGSDSTPTAVTSGTSPGSVVYRQPSATGPADVTQAGGLSFYGTMGQSGNASEWEESEADLVNDSGASIRGLRGGNWLNVVSVIRADNRIGHLPSYEDYRMSFRVTSRALIDGVVPEPASLLIWEFVTGAGVMLTKWQRTNCSV